MRKRATKTFARLRTRYRLSESGLASLRSNLHDLRTKRAELTQRLRAIKTQESDNHTIEDSGYIQTMSTIHFLDAETQRLEEVVTHAEVVKTKPRRRVRLGSKVRLQGSGMNREYTIVNSIEADPFAGKISDESPLGRELLGKRIRDMIVLAQSAKQKPLTLRLVGIS